MLGPTLGEFLELLILALPCSIQHRFLKKLDKGTEGSQLPNINSHQWSTSVSLVSRMVGLVVSDLHCTVPQ